MRLRPVPIATPTIRSTETRIDCWMQWFLEKAYVEEDQTDATYFAIGTATHKAAEMLVRGQTYAQATKAMTDYIVEWEARTKDQYVIETRNRPREGMVESAQNLLKNWWDMVHPDGAFMAAELTDLSWPPQAEILIEFTTPGGTAVRTECDTLYYRDDQPVVIDWKSGSSKSGDDRQLWLYWYGLVMMGIIPEDYVFEAYFGYLDAKEIVQTKLVYPGHEAMGYFIDEMESRRRGKTYMPVPSWKCKYCPVYRACPVFESNDALPWPELLGLMDSLEFREE